jgi:single-strand DNA-binding protein
MYNRVILLGNLTRDVELRYTPSGMAIGKVGIATNRRFKSANGEQRDETMFIDLTFFGRTAEIANQYLKRGSKILVEGRLILEQWTAQDGTKRAKHSITVDSMQMVGGRANSSGDVPQNQNVRQNSNPTTPKVPEIDIDINNDIPF